MALSGSDATDVPVQGTAVMDSWDPEMAGDFLKMFKHSIFRVICLLGLIIFRAIIKSSSVVRWHLQSFTFVSGSKTVADNVSFNSHLLGEARSHRGPSGHCASLVDVEHFCSVAHDSCKVRSLGSWCLV